MVCVGVVCLKGDQVLLIERGRPPRQSQWSIPGGKVELGESLKAAALRELAEETGVLAEIIDLIDVYEIIEDEFHYVLVDYSAKWLAHEPKANDDATKACFMTYQEALTHLSYDDLKDVVTKAYIKRA